MRKGECRAREDDEEASMMGKRGWWARANDDEENMLGKGG
jgi:hypothetical protein